MIMGKILKNDYKKSNISKLIMFEQTCNRRDLATSTQQIRIDTVIPDQRNRREAQMKRALEQVIKQYHLQNASCK